MVGAVLGVLCAPDARGGRAGNGDGDGALLPQWSLRALLAATVVGYAAGMREAFQTALSIIRVYGRV